MQLATCFSWLSPLRASFTRLLFRPFLVLLGAASVPVLAAERVAAFSAAQAPVAQTGAAADELRKRLASVRLPAGFVIELAALVPNARLMAVAPSGRVVIVGTRKDTLWALLDRGVGSAADAAKWEVRPFASAMGWHAPHGLCWAPDGGLIVAQLNRVSRFAPIDWLALKPAGAGHTSVAEPLVQGRDAADGTVRFNDLVRPGELIHPAWETTFHGSRVCRIGPDGKLYLYVGQPHNVPPRERLEEYARLGMGGIIRMSPQDGSGREVYARGIRNSVGIAFHPTTGQLWFTDNQTDGMGDDIPPGELNRVTAAGQHFGYPWLGGRSVRIREYGYDKDPLPPDLVPPQIEWEAHAADLGLMFYTGSQFPAQYRGGIFSAQHGSWNRSSPVGARIMFTSLKADGSADRTSVFAEGWLGRPGKPYWGRPVDVAMLPDGSLLVSDDHAGAIYRIRYTGKP